MKGGRFAAVLLVLTICRAGEVYDPRPVVRKCEAPRDEGTGSGSERKYFFNSNSRDCKAYTYTGHGGFYDQVNRFNSRLECETTCRCYLRLDQGSGQLHSQRYYYDRPGHSCNQFTYLGGGGNENNYYDRMACRDACMSSGGR
uniref:Ctr_79_T conopeptide n=1 Tax=Conus tribblei TaxID=101761 RepID=A0A0C9S5Z0_CONTD